MGTQLIVRLQTELKERMTQLARAEGKSPGQVVRELIEGYIRQRDVAADVENLWNQTGSKMKARGIGPREIWRTIRQARAGKS